MWRTLPLDWLIAYFVVGSGIAFILVWLAQGRPHFWRQRSKIKAIKSFSTILSISVSAFGIFTALLGTYMWGPLSLIPGFSSYVFSNVSGDWVGEIKSNYRNSQTGEASPPIPVKVKIEQDFFALKVNLISAGAYTESRTVSIWADKDPETKIQRLWYVYKAGVRHPAADDSEGHFGAGALEVRTTPTGTLLDGYYWTNRNWQRRGNTAGTISLHPKTERLEKIPNPSLDRTPSAPAESRR